MIINGKAFRFEVVTTSFGKLGRLIFDLEGEKVNKFNRLVMSEFETLIDRLETAGKQKEIDALVLFSGKPGNFIAGADIQLIQAAKTAQEATDLARVGQKLLDRWEDLPFPTIVGVAGTCMGGGCELSLASSAIVLANDNAVRIGLPETMLGIIPGMGGCIRMPWKVGIATALDLILAGKTLNPDKAQKAGLADAVLPKENFEENVISWIASNFGKLKNRQRIAREPKLGGMGGPVGKALEAPIVNTIVFKKAREGVLAKTKGQYPALLEALDVIQETGTGYQANFRGEERNKAMIREADGFGKCAETPISKSLIRLFFMTEAVKKSNGLPEGNSVETSKIQNAAVLGAGVMGGGIAHLFADKGIAVRMKDISNAALETGVQAAMNIFKKGLRRKALTQRQVDQKLNLIVPTITFDGFVKSQVVVEAVVEKMDVKKSVLAELEKHVKDDCVIASNTSSLSISEMQNALAKPERFAGMHFFNPVNKMPLVEVIRGAKSSDQAVAQIYQLSKQLGKTPIVVKDAPGFLVNRLLMPYLAESAQILVSGATIPEIDRAMLNFGMPMGPIELIDEVGLDVAEKVAHILHDAFGSRMEAPNAFVKLIEKKRLGKKSGSGFYVYSSGKEKVLEDGIYDLLGIPVKAGQISETEIVERCVFGMINEAARCLEEKIVETPADVDLGMIMGTGFPPFRGGLMRYAESVGYGKIVERLTHYQKTVGPRFEPSAALRKMVT